MLKDLHKHGEQWQHGMISNDTSIPAAWKYCELCLCVCRGSLGNGIRDYLLSLSNYTSSEVILSLMRQSCVRDE